MLHLQKLSLAAWLRNRILLSQSAPNRDLLDITRKALRSLVVVVIFSSISVIVLAYRLHVSASNSTSDLSGAIALSQSLYYLENLPTLQPADDLSADELADFYRNLQSAVTQFHSSLVDLQQVDIAQLRLEALQQDASLLEKMHKTIFAEEQLRQHERTLLQGHYVDSEKIYFELYSSLLQVVGSLEDTLFRSRDDNLDTSLEDFSRAMDAFALLPSTSERDAEYGLAVGLYTTFRNLRDSYLGNPEVARKEYAKYLLSYSSLQRRLYTATLTEHQHSPQSLVKLHNLLRDEAALRARCADNLSLMSASFQTEMLEEPMRNQRWFSNGALYAAVPLGIVFILLALFLYRRMMRQILSVYEDAKRMEAKRLALQSKREKSSRLEIAGETARRIAHEVLNPISAMQFRVESCKSRTSELKDYIEVLRILLDQLPANRKKTEQILERITKVRQWLESYQTSATDDFQFVLSQTTRITNDINKLRERTKEAKNYSMFPIADVLTDLKVELSDYMEKKGITFSIVSIDNVDLLEIYADRSDIYIMLRNLVRNSALAILERTTENKRSIRLTTSLRGNHVVFEVTDTGVGLSKDLAERVFDSDYTTRGTDGTGFGLSYSRRLARSYDGGLRVVTEATTPGKGATFQAWVSADFRRTTK